jgi:ribose transport system substrate-binding protein
VLSLLGIGLIAVVAVACGSSNESATGKSSSSGNGSGKNGGYTIALSNAFLGNGWRHSMVDAWTKTAKKLKSQGTIKDFKVDNAPQNTASSQISQIQSLILSHVDAITIDSASPTALNPVIKKACDAGIKVVVFDSLASAKCEYNLYDPFPAWGLAQVKSIVKGMHGKGNLIVAQGVVGSKPNKTVMGVWKKYLAKYPKIHTVATVDGENDDATVQKALSKVLPSLSKVDGVLIQGGAAGVVKAFKAANRPIPAIDFDTLGSSLRLWKKLHEKNGFSTTGVNTDPGQGTAALQEAVLLLQKKKINGKAIPKELHWPMITVPQKDLDAWIKVTPPTGVTAYLWPRNSVIDGIKNQQAGKEVKPPPIPTS